MSAPSLRLREYERVVILTGAGVSVASGLPTYRGAEGLWRDENKRNLATAEAVASRPREVWEAFVAMRQKLLTASPNPAHRAIAEMEHHIATGGSVTVVTQNVDGLHQMAGSTRVIELHGSLRHSRCSNGRCDLAPFRDEGHAESPPECPRCHAPLRPDVVLFGEPLGGAEHLAKRALRDCDLFLSVGTSSTVWPAASFVRSAEYAGARTISINPDPEPQPGFAENWTGLAEVLLPALVDSNDPTTLGTSS